jgi:hypothetical protein
LLNNKNNSTIKNWQPGISPGCLFIPLTELHY